MANAYVPDVKTASWRHPYKFSGRVPFVSFLMMLGFGAVTAAIAGVGGYFGGGAARWLALMLFRLSGKIAVLLEGWGVIGTGVAWVVILFPLFAIGFGYPAIIGGIAGSGVLLGARSGKCRGRHLAGFTGFLAGVGAYAAFIATIVFMKAEFHESSRILEVVSPPGSSMLMVVDALIVLWAARNIARSLYDTPFCEACRSWYRDPVRAAIGFDDAGSLVRALATGSTAPLQGVQGGLNAGSRVELSLSRCECGQSDHVLNTVLRSLPDRKGNPGTKDKAWFNTLVPAALGAELERWIAAQKPVVPAQKAVEPATSQPGAAAPSAKAVEPAASQRGAAAPSAELCTRCGHPIDNSKLLTYTCSTCGHTRWTEILVTLGMGLGCLAAAYFWGPNITARFWRGVVIWGVGIFGGLAVLLAVLSILKGAFTPLKPLAAVPAVPVVQAAPTTAEGVAAAEAPAAVPDSVAELNAAIVRATMAKAAASADAPQPEPAQAAPAELDWLAFSRLAKAEDFEELARILVRLDKRSDAEYASDKAAYAKTVGLIKDVGRVLDRQGGEDLMVQVLTRARELGCNARFIEGEWNGIGTWMG